MKIILVISFLLAGIFNPMHVFSQAGDITIRVTSLRNLQGHLLVSLFNEPSGFPGEVEAAFRNKKIEVTEKEMQLTFEDIPYGAYAIIFLHDENGNEKMDTNFVGIPQEGYGASNNAVNTFSAPKYRDAKFELNQPHVSYTLKTFY